MLRRSKIFGVISRRGQLVANLAVTAVSLCLSLIVAEFVLRSMIPLDSTGRPFEYRIPHPVFGWVLKPDTTYRFRMADATVSVTYNSQGWRDVEHTVDKPEGVYRILILGDSFMEANSVELNEAFHSRLEVLARESGRNVEVINMGVAGYGTLQEYLVFRDIGKLYQPDLVLLGFFDGNDLMNNSAELAAMSSGGNVIPDTRPFAELQGPTEWVITPVNFERAQQKYAEYQAGLEANRNTLTEKVLLLKLARGGLDRILSYDLIEDGTSDTQSVDRERQELAVLGVNYCDEPAEFTRAWDVTERVLASLKEEVDAIDSELVVFTVPALEQVSLDYMQSVRAKAADPDKLCLEQAPGNERLSGILNKLDITEIALLPDFRRVMREDGIDLFRYSEGAHWNPAGHNLAAERVVFELIAQGLLPVPGE